MIRVSAHAGSTTNAVLELYAGRRRLASTRIEHGTARIVLPRQRAGAKSFTLRYLGTSTTSPATGKVDFVVHRS